MYVEKYFFLFSKKRQILIVFKAKIIKNNAKESDDVFADFYMDLCHCHKAVGMMNFM